MKQAKPVVILKDNGDSWTMIRKVMTNTEESTFKNGIEFSESKIIFKLNKKLIIFNSFIK